jgi:hypothetical protein
MEMKTKTSFDDYLKKFINEYLKGLPQSFESVHHYLDSCMFLFNGWDSLKMFPEYTPSKYKALEEIVNEIDQFDTALGRPIEMNTIRSIAHNPTWREICKKIRMLQF